MICKYLLLFELPFYFLDGILFKHKVLSIKFWCSPKSYIYLLLLCFCCRSCKKPLSNLRLWRFMPISIFSNLLIQNDMWNILFYLFIWFELCWVFVAARQLSLVAESGALTCCGWQALNVVVPLVSEHRLQGVEAPWVQGLNCSVTCGIFWVKDQAPVPCAGRRILIHCTTREVLETLF